MSCPTRAERGAAGQPGGVSEPSRRSRLAVALLPALAILYLLLPGHPASMLDGLPLGPWELGLVLAVGIVLYGFGAPHPSRGVRAVAAVLVLLTVAKLLLWWGAPTY